MCQLSGDAWLSVATAGISTMAECWASLAEAIVQGKTAKKQASVIVFILGSFLVWEQRERDEIPTTKNYWRSRQARSGGYQRNAMAVRVFRELH